LSCGRYYDILFFIITITAETKYILLSKIIKFFTGLSLGLMVCLLLAFNVLLVWVATGPRSLSALTPYIESSLQPPGREISVNIGETWLIWDGWSHPIDIRLHDVTLMTANHQILSQLSQVSLGLDVLSIPLGRIVPTSLTVSKPSINLVQNADHTLSFGLADAPAESSPAVAEAVQQTSDAIQEAPAAAETETETEAGSEQPAEMHVQPTLPFLAVAAPFLEPEKAGNFSKLRSITITDATLSVSRVDKGLFFTVKNADVSVRRARSGLVSFASSGLMQYGDYSTNINAEMLLPARSGENVSTINGTLEFAPLVPDVLAGLFSSYPEVKILTMPIGGKVGFTVGMDGALQRLHFDLQGGKGSITHEKLDGAIPITNFNISASLSNDLQKIDVESFTADFEGAKLSANGVLDIANNDPAVNLTATLENLPTKDVHLFWPAALAPLSRDWITQNISEGIIPKASVVVAIQKGDYAKPVLPRESVDATIQIEGMKIRYLPEHPPTHGVKGTVKVDGLSLKAELTGAEYLKATKLERGTLLIDDLNADNPYITLDLSLGAPATDIVHFLGLPRLEHAKRLGLREDEIKGTVSGNAKVGFHFFTPTDARGKPIEDDISYDVSASLKDISQNGFMGKFDATSLSGDIKIDVKELVFTGAGSVNGAEASAIAVKYFFTPENGLDTFVDVTATAPLEVLPRFGYPKFPFLSGVLGVKASLAQGEVKESATATIDLVEAGVNVKEIGWQKPPKEPAQIELSTEKRDGRMNITQFSVTGKDIQAKGSAVLSGDSSSIESATVKDFRYGKNDLTLFDYEQSDNILRLHFKGASLDATSYLEHGDGEFSFERFPPLSFVIDVGKVTMGEGREFQAVKGSAECSKQRCGKADIKGQTSEGKPFSLSILNNPQGKRQLAIRAEDAGAFLKGIGVFDSMEGGALTMVGNYEEKPDGSVLNGRLNISEHTISDAPILARILSLASLTGFIDTLQGNGIRFVKLTMPFVLSNDVLTIENGKTIGSAMGLTAEGTITFPAKTMDIAGTVVPSYTLNTVVDKVPLLGTILTGGKGEGVFAARYRIKGAEKDRDVSVNPLSFLTPGFLRGLFDILDEPKIPAQKPARAEDLPAEVEEPENP
jgi:hypothetical protein